MHYTLNFRKFFEVAGATLSLTTEPGVVKVLEAPQNSSDYNLRYQGGFLLQPNQKIYYVVPEQFKGKIIRDMQLAHKKGPHGHGEPNMQWEEGKKKWRDYYGAYSKIEVHDTLTNKWFAYSHGGRDYKFAEFKQSGNYEIETLHDWVGKIGRISPDLIRITNPGNQRPNVNKLTGEKVDPFDIRSTVDIGPLEIMYLPQNVAQAGNKFIERVYSPVGYFKGFTPTKFANYTATGQEAVPSYPHYGIGYYPGALYLYAVPYKAERWLKRASQYQGQEKVHKHILTKHNAGNQEGPVTKDHMFVPGDKYYIVNKGTPLFSVKLDPMEGKGDENAKVTKEGTSQITIWLPEKTNGSKLVQVEVMCGDSEARPDRAVGKPGDSTGDESDKVRRGGATLSVVFDNAIIGRHPVAPQMVAASHPGTNENLIKPNSTIKLMISGDSAWIMAWRVTYQSSLPG